MPKINSFRIVNFSYDDGRKRIANELYKLDGNNTLINLENGGGKSVIIHLLLNVVMPKVDMGTRKISDYFKDNSTTHLLIEWQLDTRDKSEKLLTGMCLKRNDTDIAYFNYSNNYSNEDDYDINNIPVINERDKTVKSYSEWANEIKIIKNGRKMQYFPSYEKKEKYLNFLNEFKIYDTEFKAIKTINETEGGVDKFFKKAKKSKDILNSIIIPSITDIQYKDNKANNELGKSFQKHIEKLKSIPDLQKKIIVYDKFLDKGNKILDDIENYKTLIVKKKDLGRDTLENKIIIKNLISTLNNYIDTLGKEITTINTRIKELEYKNKSLESYNINLDISKLNQKINDLESKIIEKTDEIKEKQQNINYLKSSVKYAEIIKCEKEIAKNEAIIQKISEEKANQEYVVYLRTYKEILENSIKDFGENIKEVKHSNAELKDDYDKLKNDIDDYKNKRDSIKENINQNIGGINHIKDILIDLESKIGENLIYIYEINKKKIEEKNIYEQIIESIKNNNEEERKSIDKEKTIVKEINNIEKEIFKINENKQKLDNQKDDYLKELNIMKSSINYDIESMHNIYDENIRITLENKEKSQSVKITELEIKLKELKIKHELYKDTNYYIPYRDILEVKEALDDQDIVSITGIDYLKNQKNQDEFIKKYPIIPYSICIRKEDLNNLKYIMDDIKDIEKPVPFYILDDIKLDESINIQNNSYYKVEHTELYLLKTDNIKYILDDDEFNKYKESIESKINITDDNLNSNKDTLKRIQNNLIKYDDFIRKYPKDFENKLLNDIKKIEIESNNNKDRLKEKVEGKEQTENEIKELKKELIVLNDRLKVQEEKIRNIEEYIKNKNNQDKIVLENDKLTVELNSIVEIIDEKEKEFNNIGEKINTNKEKLKALKEENNNEQDLIENNNIEINRFKDVDIKLVVIKEESRQVVEGKLEGLKRKVDNFDVDNLRKLITKYKQDVNRLEKEIKDLGYNIKKVREGIVSLSSDADENKIKEAEKEKDRLSQEKDELGKSKVELIGDLNTKQGELNAVNKDIKKTYYKEPYNFTYNDILDENYYQSKIKEEKDCRNKQESIKNKKQDDSSELNSYLINRLKPFITDNNIYDFIFEEDIDIDKLKEFDKEKCEALINEFNENKKNVNAFYDSIKEKINKLRTDKEVTSVVKSTDKIIDLLKEDMESCDIVIRMFKENLEKTQRIREATINDLEIIENGKKHIVTSCIQRSKTLLDQLNEVDSFSKIKINNKNVKLIKFQFPKLSDEEWKSNLDTHISMWIEEIIQKDDLQDPAKIEKEIMNFVRPEELLDAAIDLGKVRIKICKPRNDIEKPDYYDWEEVVNWSGGEKLSAFFAMFISIISHLRSKRSNDIINYKVVFIDNPFGQANAEFLLNYIFKLAIKNNTQMICFTGISEENIFKQFPLILSLVHREVTVGRSYLVEEKRIENKELEGARFKINGQQESMIF